jgi:hypothetical protein
MRRRRSSGARIDAQHLGDVWSFVAGANSNGAGAEVRFAGDSLLEEGGFELVVPLCLGIDIVIGNSSLVPREFGLARQAYGAIAS